MTSTINLKTLAAMTQAASKEQMRIYLCGAAIEVDTHGITYVSTDGHLLLASREELPEDAPRNETLGTWIIPTAECLAAKLGKRDMGEAVFSANKEGKVTLTSPSGTSRTFQAVDGTFPDWKRVVPQHYQRPCHDPEKAANNGAIEVNQFDPALLAKLAKFHSLMSGQRQAVPVLHHGEKGYPIPVTFPGIDATCQAFGVLMPHRATDEAFALPAWANVHADKDEQLAA